MLLYASMLLLIYNTSMEGIMIKCIYCLQDKDKTHFKKKEHVLSQSFGKFKDNFTLINTVCDECNQFFGDNLELVLAGDTVEGGTTRYETGIKDPEKFKSLGKRSRMTYQIQEGKYPGVYMYREYSEEVGNITFYPCPQIGFLRNSGEYEWFLLNDIPKKEAITHEVYNISDPKFLIMLGCDESIEEKILNEFGIKRGEAFMVSHDHFKEKILFEVQGKLDEVDFRARAKIGFNYLAYWQGNDFILDSSFNTIRDYIRWGKVPETPIRGVINKPFFPDAKRRLGHIIAIHWEEKEASLVARVSLFDFLQFVIRLVKDEAQQYKDVRKGHFFNIKQMNILELDLSKFNLSF